MFRQSLRMPIYERVLQGFERRGLIYRCSCSRKEIAEAMSAPQESRSAASRGSAYPGTCRPGESGSPRTFVPGDRPHALRLDMRRAISELGGTQFVRGLSFEELGNGRGFEPGSVALDPDLLVESFGDVVLARKDTPTSYHLAVVIDDAAQGVSHVTRGEDLFESTAIHRLLQALLNIPVPTYRHHPLVRDEAGNRLAKRNRALSLSVLRASGATPADIRNLLPPLD